MDLISTTAIKISEQFIRAENGHANKELNHLSQLLLQNPNSLNNPKLLTVLQQIVTAQEQKDYLFIADLLTYQLIPLLAEQ